MQAEACGKAFLGPITYIKNNGGDDLLEEILDLLEPETRLIFNERIRVVSWYPYPQFVDFLHVLDNKLGNGDGSMCRHLGDITGRRDMGTIFRIYRTLASAERLIRSCGRIWKTYYRNAGTMEAISAEPDNTVLRINDFPQMDPHHCQLMEGWMTSTMDSIGFQIVEGVTEVKCTSRGDPHHEFFCTWQHKS